MDFWQKSLTEKRGKKTHHDYSRWRCNCQKFFLIVSHHFVFSALEVRRWKQRHWSVGPRGVKLQRFLCLAIVLFLSSALLSPLPAIVLSGCVFRGVHNKILWLSSSFKNTSTFPCKIMSRDHTSAYSDTNYAVRGVRSKNDRLKRKLII